MSASPRIDLHLSPPSGLAEALYFTSGQRQLFGWLHRPIASESSNTGIVICQPFGYEALCAHRGMRSIAESATRLGIPTLRFDYSGTGDSEDVGFEANQLELWTQDVTSAVAELRRRTAVEQVCLLGLRLGALVAAAIARRCKPVTSLILIAPVLNGQRYVRELKVTNLAGLLTSQPARASGNQQSEPPDPASDVMEISGFPLLPATRAALAEVDLLTAPPPARQVLLLDEKILPTAREWAGNLSAAGVTTTYTAMSGLFKMAMSPPHFSNVPQPMIAAINLWLHQFRFTGQSINRGVPVVAGLTAPAMTLNVRGEGSGRPDVVERPIFIASQPALFGIVTEPRRTETNGRAVILLNQGANHHIGGSRMSVSFARRWAARGLVVLRLDLAGIGDSAIWPGNADDSVFPPTALDDIRAAIDLLRNHYDINHVTLGGLCSGAYHALRAAIAGLPIDRVLLVNPVNFFWKKGMNLHEVQLAQVVRNPSQYYERIFSSRVLKKLITGRVDLARIVRVYLNSLIPFESALRDLARRLRIRLPVDLGRELELVAARGVRLVFVFARGDPGVDLLKLQAGSSISRMGDLCKVRVIDGGDHNFSLSAARATMERILTDELFSAEERNSWASGL